MRPEQSSPLLLLSCLFAVACSPSEPRSDAPTTDSSGAPSSADEGAVSSFPRLAGPYLGQPPALSEPALFAPGIVSGGLGERDVAMMPDGSEIYWGETGANYAWSTILMSRRVDGIWTRPEVAPCCLDGGAVHLEPHISPDGMHFFWLSTREGPGPHNGGQEIWVMDREGDGWGNPHPLPENINTAGSEYFPSTTRDGTLYFTRGPAGGGENRIWRSRKVDGIYQEPELLPAQVNAGVNRFNAFVDPDETYLVLGVAGMADSFGGTDYYIVFRNDRDEWSEPVNLGPRVNTPGSLEYSAYVSPDGDFLFFMSQRPDWEALAPGGTFDAEALMRAAAEPENGNMDIYWMRADFLEELRPRGF